MSAEIVDLSKKKEKHSFIETKNSFALEFLKKALDEKTTIQEFDEAFSKLKENSPEKKNFSFVDNTENNSSNIEIAKDPGRALIERITNGIDSVLEDTFESRNEQNPPLTPHKAAEKWFGISEKQGIKGLSYSERMKMGKDFLLVRQLKGNDTSNQIIDVIDKGTGIDQSKFKDTILSISKSNKIRKKYVMGQYGHGGSSTFKFSKKTLIVSRTKDSNHISFTVVWYMEPGDFDDTLKVGSYIYFTENNLPIAINSNKLSIEKGTTIRHFGYDASKYPQPLGLRSLFGNCQKNLFNPAIPYVLNLPGRGNRSMIGARSSLLGAFDEADVRTKVEVDHFQSRSCIMISDGQLGKIWVEYWLASRPKRVEKYNKKKKKKEFITQENPINSLIDKNKPIIFTHNGQNQHEENASLVAHKIGLPYLKNRLVIHVDCNDLAPVAKRRVFSSSREGTAETAETREIINQIINFVKSDDALKVLNDQAAEDESKETNLHNKDTLKREVSKLLNLKGGDLKSLLGFKSEGTGKNKVKNKPRPPSPKPKPIRKHIKLEDPPTFINILWPDDRDITFYKGRQRWIRVETNAYNYYQDKINFSINGSDLEIKSRTDLNDGRIRFLVSCKDKTLIDNKGSIEVKISDEESNLNIKDSRAYKIVEIPEEKPTQNDDDPTQPDYVCIPVKGKSDPTVPFERLFLDEDDAKKYDEEDVAFRYDFIKDDKGAGKLKIYYNTEFKNYKNSIEETQRRGSTSKVNLLRGKFEIYISAASYLDYNEKENNKYKDNDTNKNFENSKFQDLMRIKNNSFAAAELMLIKQELFKRNND